MMKRSLMKYGVAATLLAMLCPWRAGAQELTFSGYAANLPIYQQLNSNLSALFGASQHQFLDITRIRLRPVLNLWDGGRIALEHEITGLYRSSAVQLLTSASLLRRQAIRLDWTPADDPHIMVRHFVDRLYFRQNFLWGSISIGRQRVSWGTGRIWNPTDLFNPINPASFDKIEKDGADAASVKYYFGDFTALEIVYNAEHDFAASNVAARFQTNVGEFDLSVMGGAFDRRGILGADFAGNMLDAGVRGEGMFAFDSDGRKGFLRFVLGADYQFTGRLYALAEYLYNGEGKTGRAQYELLRLISGEILNLGRHYLFLNSVYQLHPLVNGTLGGNINLTDGSGFITPGITYSVSPNVDVSLGGLLTYGPAWSEYWYYGTSIYLKMVAHF